MPQNTKFTKLATAPTLQSIEEKVNKYLYSTTYKVNPQTLDITSSVKGSLSGFAVAEIRRKGQLAGYVFNQIN
jgi:hypothetical protein